MKDSSVVGSNTEALGRALFLRATIQTFAELLFSRKVGFS